jgi:predicted alpha/beta-hydrolase family hydrolase
MNAADAEPLTLDLSDGARVSALWQSPKEAVAAFVFAHGAGAGMSHPFMAAAAGGLATFGIATLRYQFPYRERGSKRPDPPALCHATIRSAVAAARQRAPKLATFAGGRSFGARMTSQAQAISPLPGVLGLAFLGFPLHAPKQPSDSRAEHLSRVAVPMLFLQGSRDEFADRTLLLPLMERLGKRATLRSFEHADHSFHVPVRSGRNDGEVLSEALQILAEWMTGVMHGS